MENILWDEKKNTDEELRSLNDNISSVFSDSSVLIKVGSFVARDNAGNRIISDNRSSQMYIHSESQIYNDIVGKDISADFHVVFLDKNALNENVEPIICEISKYHDKKTDYETCITNYYVGVKGKENAIESVHKIMQEMEEYGFYRNRCNEIAMVEHLSDKGYVTKGGNELLKMYKKEKVKNVVDLSPDCTSSKSTKGFCK